MRFGFKLKSKIKYRKFRGQTALHKSAGNKHRGICYMLVAAGANLSLKDADGHTPMIHAFNANDHDLAAYLESKYTRDRKLVQKLITYAKRGYIKLHLSVAISFCNRNCNQYTYVLLLLSSQGQEKFLHMEPVPGAHR